MVWTDKTLARPPRPKLASRPQSKPQEAQDGCKQEPHQNADPGACGTARSAVPPVPGTGAVERAMWPVGRAGTEAFWG
eukprot:7380650-Alexandrium_andersonii.AAC.1